MQCRSCQATLPPGTSTCPGCGSTLTSTSYAYDDALPYSEHIQYMEQPAPSGYMPSSPIVVSQNVSTLEPGSQIPVIAAPVIAERRNGTPGWMIVLLVLLSLLLVIGGGGVILYAAAFSP